AHRDRATSWAHGAGALIRRAGLDRPLLVTVLALITLGLFTLYSAGETDFPTLAADIWRRQAMWLGLGAVGAVMMFRMSPRILEWFTPFLYGGALFLLVVVLFFGTGAGTAAGTHSWLSIGGVRVGQPAELAKLATILMLARHLAGRRECPATLVELVPAGVIVGTPLVLVALQPDLGSALVFLGIFFGMLYWVGVTPWLLLLIASPVISLIAASSTGLWAGWIIILTLLLIWLRPYLVEGLAVWGMNVMMGVVAVRLWTGLAPYQQNRILSFVNPEIDPRAAGWNIIQSKVAIGSGGWMGKGFTLGTQKRLAFLPAQHTDFVFPVLAEEFGFWGVAVALALFFWFFMVLIRIARRAVDTFSCVMVAGVAGLLLTHVVENVGMTVGLLPVTGIPLPFFSYGGSFAIICLLAVGMTLRVAWDSRSGGYLEG
ncbi:MAG: rod shape-determining protein RodA, partial [Gemmatimonadetes bacterium]|nr:rod shape-determining protein RodA [Gemmatimonadota bacterium]